MFTVKPVLSEETLGHEVWRILHEDARRLGYGRPTAYAIALIQWAIVQRLAGKNVQLTTAQLDRLLGRELPTVA